MLQEIEYELKDISDKILIKIEKEAWEDIIKEFEKLRKTFLDQKLNLQATISLISIASLREKQRDIEKAGNTMLAAAKEFESNKKMGYALRAYQRSLTLMKSLDKKNLCEAIEEKIESLGMLDLVIVTDSTGSMGSALNSIKKEIAKMLYILSDRIPGVRVGALTYRDHCDKENSYLLQTYPFTEPKDYSDLINFIKEWEADGGGDFPEAVEDALSSLQNFEWDNMKKIVILIADAPPHEPSKCPNNLDWREESKKLAAEEIKIYTIQCGDNINTEQLFKEIANITRGEHFKLYNTSDLPDLIVAIGLNQVELVDDFILDLESNGELSKSKKILLENFLR